MKKEDIHLSDIYRILHGEIPYIFYVELAFRTLFVYLILTFGMRLLGKRISAEMTRSELAAISTLAAATGLVILAPDRGLLPPLIVIGVLAVIQYYLHKGALKSEKFEFATEGHLSLMVCHGTLQLEAMEVERISKYRVFAELRDAGLKNLGAVNRLYLEANGAFSVVKEDEPRPGLTVIPLWDEDFIREHEFSDKEVCCECGAPKPEHTADAGEELTCLNCGHKEFTPGMK